MNEGAAAGYSILHISDLHRSQTDPISNSELVSALIADARLYAHENTRVPAVNAIVVSGDLIQGVGLGVSNYREKLDEQYVVAEDFIVDLTNRFVGGDRSKVVIIPGNHDVDWNAAFEAMEEVPEDQFPKDISSALAHEGSDFRWDWKKRKLYRIADKSRYEQRLDAFWDFFDRFYHNVSGLLRVERGADANLFELADGRIAVAAFNSCFGNDCFAFQGMIPRAAIASSDLWLSDHGDTHLLRIAVWHHNFDGPPYRSDYMDSDLVRGMIGRGFRLGLYGHHHKAQIAAQQIHLPGQETMAAISAGSLCAGRYELPTGTHRQYNVIEIGSDYQSVKVHVREMKVANLFSPSRLPEFGGETFASLAWQRPVNMLGQPIDVRRVKQVETISAAELALKSNRPLDAIAFLRDIPSEPGSYARSLMLSAAKSVKDWPLALRTIGEPRSMDELMEGVEAHCNLRETGKAAMFVDQYSAKLEVPANVIHDLKLRIAAMGVLGK